MTPRSSKPRVLNHGVKFMLKGMDIYDGPKHIGRIAPATKSIALYKERKEYTSTMYRRKLITFVSNELGYKDPQITWF